MGVHIKDLSKLWPRVKVGRGYRRIVPYACPGQPAAKAKVEQISNRLFPWKLFVLKDDMKDVIGEEYEGGWVKIEKGGGMCQVGYQGVAASKPQVLKYDDLDDNFVHELGHCLGLGHENFHAKWPRKGDLTAGSIHKDQYEIHKPHYVSWGSYDSDSVMLYSDSAFGLDGRKPAVILDEQGRAVKEHDSLGNIRDKRKRCLNHGFSSDDLKHIVALYIA